jgi:hypothetical protein
MSVYDSEGASTALKWAATTAYTSTARRMPLAAHNYNTNCTAENTPYGCCTGSGTGTCSYYYSQTVASCTSGGTEPEWPTTIGNTVADNDCSWTCTGPNIQAGSLVGTGSDAITQSTLSESEADVTFSNLSASVTSGKLYFLVAKYSAADSSNYLKWAYATSSGNYLSIGDTATEIISTYGVQTKFTIYR